jgi:hypothetical protein
MCCRMRAHAAGSEHGNLVEGGETRQAVTSLFPRLLCLSSVFLTRSGRPVVVKGMAWPGGNCHPRDPARPPFKRGGHRGPERGLKQTKSKREANESRRAWGCRTSCASYSGLSGSEFCLSSPTRCVGPFDLDNPESRSVPSPRSARLSCEHRWVFRRGRRFALKKALRGTCP